MVKSLATSPIRQKFTHRKLMETVCGSNRRIFHQIFLRSGGIRCQLIVKKCERWWQALQRKNCGQSIDLHDYFCTKTPERYCPTNYLQQIAALRRPTYSSVAIYIPAIYVIRGKQFSSREAVENEFQHFVDSRSRCTVYYLCINTKFNSSRFPL